MESLLLTAACSAAPAYRTSDSNREPPLFEGGSSASWDSAACGQPVESPLVMSAGRRLSQVHHSGGLHIHRRATSANERTRTSNTTTLNRRPLPDWATLACGGGSPPCVRHFPGCRDPSLTAESRRVEHQRFHVDPLSRRSPSPSGITLQEMQVWDSSPQARPSPRSPTLSSRSRTGPCPSLHLAEDGVLETQPVSRPT
jgi:hypothetical protein